MKKLVINSKKGQHTMGLPFSFIFAILLIVVFIVIAFIAINHFLDIGRCSKIGLFYDELQNEVNDVLASQESSKDFDTDLPSGINKVCFAVLSEEITNEEDYEKIKNYDVYNANVFLVPPEKACNMPYKLIKNINISEITGGRNPYCVDVYANLKIKKGIYDKLVLIS